MPSAPSKVNGASPPTRECHARSGCAEPMRLAVSVASVLLLTEATLTEIPESKTEHQTGTETLP